MDNPQEKNYYSRHIFEDVFTPSRQFVLVEAVKNLLEIQNAGGSSAQLSEYFSGVIFHGLGGKNFIEEMAVPYWWDWKKVDYLCTIMNRRIGVSVKRAINKELMMQLKTGQFTDTRQLIDTLFDEKEAERFLNGAIRGLMLARRCIFQDHDFDKAVLHVWCPTIRIAKLIRQVFERLDIEDMDDENKGFLILHMTLCYDTRVYIGE